MANEISNANAPSVVDSNSNPVEDATIIAVKQEDVAALSQSQATEIQALAKLTDVNGDFKFTQKELYNGDNQYVVVPLEESGEQRGTPNYPHVDANGIGIPNSAVDNFEGVNSTPSGVYKSGETVADYYVGDTSVYQRTDNGAVAEGNFALQHGGRGSPQAIVSESGMGLNRYPQKGDVISVYTRSLDSSDATVVPETFFGADYNNGSQSGYTVEATAVLGKFKLSRIDNASETNLASKSVSIDAYDWYEIEVEWHDGSGSESDNTIVVNLYDLDQTDLLRNSKISTISATDSNYSNNRGIGFTRDSGTGGTYSSFWDSYRVTGTV